MTNEHIQRSNAAGNWLDWQIDARDADTPTANRPVFRVNWNGDRRLARIESLYLNQRKESRKMERRQLILTGLGLLGTAAVTLAAEENKDGGQKPVRVVDPDTNPETLAGVKAVLAQHDKAFAAQDLEGVLATYAPGPHTVLMGTGPGEMWAGQEEIGDAYKHFFADFDKGAQNFKYDYVNGMTRGDVAWLSVMGGVEGRKGAKEMTFPINISCVLVKDQGLWKISLLHFSNPTGPEKPQK